MKTILIPADHTDARAHLQSQSYLKPLIIVTPRSMRTARGWIGPVYATAAAKAHHKYPAMLQETAPCSHLVDSNRVA